MNKKLSRFVVDGVLVLLLLGLFALPVASFAFLGVNPGASREGVLSVQDERPDYTGELELLNKDKINEIIRAIVGEETEQNDERAVPEVSSTTSVRR